MSARLYCTRHRADALRGECPRCIQEERDNLKTKNKGLKMEWASEHEGACWAEAIIENRDKEISRLRAALRRAYRKSEVLDEPGFALSFWSAVVAEGDPDFDTIKSAFGASDAG